MPGFDLPAPTLPYGDFGSPTIPADATAADIENAVQAYVADAMDKVQVQGGPNALVLAAQNGLQAALAHWATTALTAGAQNMRRRRRR